ncbi:unnamed protein product [Phaedon cochleariae]|uniref:Pre-C2HC domain-containing protein n=1 Tax=Phaedon cochleariae TaxID=80249 RepID=A0A9N9SCH9_PHACE|nr:unnamed protein product [Phaedon cochleariae]
MPRKPITLKAQNDKLFEEIRAANLSIAKLTQQVTELLIAVNNDEDKQTHMEAEEIVNQSENTISNKPNDVNQDGEWELASSSRSKKRKAKKDAGNTSASNNKIAKSNATSGAEPLENSSATQDANQNNSNNNDKIISPPSIVLRNTEIWGQVSRYALNKKIGIAHAKNITDGVSINPDTPDDYRKLIKLFDENKVEYHTYMLPDDKLLHVVIKGIPEVTDTDEINPDLENKGFHPELVSQMTSRRTKKALPMFLVQLPKNESNIYELNECYYLKISVEKQNKQSGPTQCYRSLQMRLKQKLAADPIRKRVLSAKPLTLEDAVRVAKKEETIRNLNKIREIECRAVEPLNPLDPEARNDPTRCYNLLYILLFHGELRRALLGAGRHACFCNWCNSQQRPPPPSPRGLPCRCYWCLTNVPPTPPPTYESVETLNSSLSNIPHDSGHGSRIDPADPTVDSREPTPGINRGVFRHALGNQKSPTQPPTTTPRAEPSSTPPFPRRGGTDDETASNDGSGIRRVMRLPSGGRIAVRRENGSTYGPRDERTDPEKVI